MDIPKGRIFGLLGPNGAGKTTILRMITNILI
ncbi:MAG: ATP-binding cassette domain-containing protein, partial [Candidatus Kapaibacterium sp.]